jgi:AcrR family transcriptional regulator
VPDIPLNPLIGGMHWLLATQLRRGKRELSRLSEDIDSWLEVYMRPLGSHRWNALQPGVAAPASMRVAELSLRAPPAVPPGRTKLSRLELAANQRERILFAIIEVVAGKGYAATTIADITTAAHVDRRVFYSHFRDKQQAFLTIHELAFQQTMAVTAGAFFGGTSWPERVWEGLLAFAHFQARHPTLAHMGFVDSYMVGSDAVRRVEDSRAAFTLFLQEGYQNASPPPPRIAMDAIAATIAELGYHLVRRGKTQLFPRLMGHSTAVTLTPFLGAEPTIDFIDRKLSEQPRVG